VKGQWNPRAWIVASAVLAVTAGCASDDVYFDPNMDFGSLQAVAVLPFENLTSEDKAAERVRDAFSSMLLATGAVYVVPPGEVAYGIAQVGRISRDGPSTEQVQKLAATLKVDALITGVVMEYGPVRSGATSANVISVSLRMLEKTQGLVVWSASSTKGGITVWDRLVGGGGEPMNDVMVEAINDLLDKLFQ
jgi:hypothetical protein